MLLLYSSGLTHQEFDCFCSRKDYYWWVKSIFEEYEVSSSLLFLKDRISAADINRVIESIDVFLSSYSYEGVLSIVNHLRYGNPTLVLEGNSMSSRQVSSILKEAKLLDLISFSESEYLHKAVMLGRDKKLLSKCRENICAKMKGIPPFLDSYSYSIKVGKVLSELYRDHVSST